MEIKKELIEATCPDCRGPLSQESYDEVREFHCLVGHTYSPSALLQAHYEAQEKTLWAAVVVLEETAKLVEAVASGFSPSIVKDLESQVATKQRQSAEIRRILENLEPFRTE